jgi:hypothetical protein
MLVLFKYMAAIYEPLPKYFNCKMANIIRDRTKTYNLFNHNHVLMGRIYKSPHGSYREVI